MSETIELDPRFPGRQRRDRLLVFGVSLALGLLFWMFDGFFHFYASRRAVSGFTDESYASLLDALLLNVSSHHLTTRVIFLVASLVSGLVATILIHRYRTSERRYRLLFENVPVGIGISAPNGTILSGNDTLVRTLGYRNTTEVEQHLGEIIDTETLERLHHRWHTQGELRAVTVTAKRRDGTTRSLRITAQPTDLGTEATILVVVEDVTEHMTAIAALRESQEMYRALADNATDAIMRFNRDLRPLYVNPAVSKLFKRTPTDLLDGVSDELNFPKELHAFWAGRVREVFERGIALSETYVYQNGQERTYIEWRLVPEFSAQGQVETVLATARDITEQRQAEEQVAQERKALAEKFEARTAELRMANAELARAARLKDEFLANMSHELRTPLTVILTFTEILRSGLYGKLDARQERPLQAIEESGKHLLSLITDILDVSKIEAGKLELDISNVPIASVCRASVQLIEAQAKKKQLSVAVDLDPNITHIRADERRLKQILVNLLGNAVKFTPSEGAIGLNVSGDVETQTVRFVVWDTGIGIAEQDMGRLFQPFVQIDSSLTRHYQGTGLGLALVRRLTDLHNGTIAVESEVGKGSRFEVSLPWIEAAAGAKNGATLEEKTATQSQNTTSARILIVEDNYSAVKPVSKFLTSLGYGVIEARDGAEAIHYAIEEQPDVILMDIQMPVMDGFEATRRIRANALTAEIPIIALTALAMPGDCERSLAAGANAYVSKPLKLKDLAEVIESQLHPGSRPTDERVR